MDYLRRSEKERVLTFFIEYYKEECIFELSEYLSIGLLKQEICQKFGIPVEDQIVEGWSTPPDNDDTILGFCSDPLMEVISLSVRSKTIDACISFSPSITKNENLELDSIIEFLDEVLLNLPTSSVAFHCCRLSDAIRNISLSSKKKIILLYLHNKHDEFATTFWQNLCTTQVAELLNRSFFVIGWNIENTKYHSALTTALGEHSLCPIKKLVERKLAAALCLVPSQNSVDIYSCMRGKYRDIDFLTGLQKAEEFVFDNIEVKQEENLKMNGKEFDNTKIKEQEDIKMNSTELQQLFADMLGNRDYNSFEYNEHEYLKKDIAYALRGPPCQEIGYDKNLLDTVEELYKKICKNNNMFCEYIDKIEISFIYNCLEPKECASDSIVNPIPIFVLRKCHNSERPCRIFIDHTGRVYEKWDNYKENVKLPECRMVLPYEGRYDFNKNGQVLLEKQLSSACSVGTKVLKGFDIGTAVAGIASTGTLAAAAALPVVAALPFVIIPALVTGAAAGVYSIARSSMTIHDRRIHQETMSITNSEARAAYLNIVAGSLGFVGVGTNLLVSQLVTQGINIGKGARFAVNAVNIANLSAGGASVVNSSFDVVDQWINKREQPSALCILQLSSSILFFGHAVLNFKTCGTIIEETQAKVLQDYQDSLRSNRHRKTFNKLLKETVRRNDGNTSRAQSEIISTLRNIQSKDEVFAVLTRANKRMNEEGIRFHAEDGQIKLNGIAIDMVEFSTMNKQEIGNFLSNLPSNSEPTPAETAQMQQLLFDNHFKMPEIKTVALYAVKLLSSFEGNIKDAIIKLVSQLLSSLSPSITNILDKLFPGYKKYLNMIDYVLEYFIKLTNKFEEWCKHQSSNNDDDELFSQMHNKVVLVKDVLKNVQEVIEFTCTLAVFREYTVKKLLNHFYTWFSKQLADYELNNDKETKRLTHSAMYPRRKKVTCSICGGYYFQ